MSDYIKRSGLAEEVIDAFCGDCTQCGGHCRHDDLVEVIEHLPTISETEIIRKAFDRVVERLREKGTWKSSISNDMIYRPRKNITVEEAIKIVKEECGISE